VGTLGRQFPPAVTAEYVGRQLTPGRVLYLWYDRARPSGKNKYFVVAHRSGEDFLLLLIVNSRLNVQRAHDELWCDCQVLMRKSTHEFLAHDSYIDCFEVHRMAYYKVRDELTKDPGGIKGELSIETRREIVQVVKTHGRKTIPSRYVAFIENSLRTDSAD